MSLLLAWLSRRSLRLLHALGSCLGWAAYALSPSYRGRLQRNAALAGVNAADRRAAVADAGPPASRPARGGGLGGAAYAPSPGYRGRLQRNAALAGVNAADRRAAVADAGRL